MGKAQLPKGLRGKTTIWGIAASLLLAGLLMGCTSTQHPAAAAVETYLQAMVDKDEARLVSLTCPAFEADALLEFDAFSLVTTRLQGLECQAQNPGDTSASVSCQGQIVATYGAEDQEFDLSERVYQVQKQEGNWLVCGQ
jgi:hypothetical protein